jgi:hypothetical protein
MSVSTKGVFHYTNSLNNLLNILANGFYPSYCKETMSYGKREYTYAIPMVSFCDIPLSEINSHVFKYGSYAIGLTREWAQKNRLNPVVYIDQNSNLAFGIINILDFIFLDWHEWLKEKEFDHFYEHVYKGGINVITSSKNFEGKLLRNGVEKEYTFYNEREWRYIPQIHIDHVTDYPDIIWDEEIDEINKHYTSKPHFKHYGVEIKANDIKYLIIPDKSFLPEFLFKLKNIKGLFEDNDQYNYLITNVVTLDRIKEDF